jgi:hypothetical protein
MLITRLIQATMVLSSPITFLPPEVARIIVEVVGKAVRYCPDEGARCALCGGKAWVKHTTTSEELVVRSHRCDACEHTFKSVQVKDASEVDGKIPDDETTPSIPNKVKRGRKKKRK